MLDCWAPSYLTDGLNERIQEVVDAGVVPRLVALINHPEVAVVTPTLRTIGDIATGSDTQTDSVLLLPAPVHYWPNYSRHSKMNIVQRKRPGQFLTSGNAENAGQIQTMITHVIRPLVDVLTIGYFKCQKE